MSHSNQVFSAFSFIGFLLCAIPLYWHLEAWNAGTSLYIAWAGLGCLKAFINSVVWDSTVSNVAPVWCDLTTRFDIGLPVGLLTALLVINRRLFKIASRTTPLSTKAERRRALFIDLAIGLGIPLLQMVLQIIVEGHRFDIFEEIGCLPNTDNVTLAFPLVFIWPPILSLITAVYSCLNIRLFWKSSQQLKGLLSSHTNPHQNRYIRLIALSSIQVLFTLPLSLYIVYFNSVAYPIDPWVSWAVTHLDYSHVGQFPAILWRANPAVGNILEVNRWLVVLSAFLFFAFFGFAEEALKHYRLAYTFAASRLRLSGLSISRASGTSPYSFTSSFGPGFRKGRADLSDSPLSSHNWPKERDTPSLVSDCRLTSNSSVFGGTDDEPKTIGFLADEDDSRPAPAADQTAIIVVPTIPRVPVPPLPIADGARFSWPPDRLNSPLPHRPTSSYLDLCENV